MKLTESAYRTAVFLVTATVIAYPVMLLWDALIPQIFGLPEIGYWQAYGLLLFCWLTLRPVATQ